VIRRDDMQKRLLATRTDGRDQHPHEACRKALPPEGRVHADT
jgi:hypothetical protein